MVLAGNPATGKANVEKVTATIAGAGAKDLVEVVIGDDKGPTVSVVATSGHSLWIESRHAWTAAAQVLPGDQLLAPSGERLAVLSVRHFTAYQRVYNLSVEDLHTYYALAAGRALLVHNCGGGGGATPGAAQGKYLYRFGTAKESAQDLADQAAAAEKNGFPHGVSTFSRSSRPDAVRALRTNVEAVFNVVKTGRNPWHYTVVLPDPVTQDVADAFNNLFGR